MVNPPPRPHQPPAAAPKPPSNPPPAPPKPTEPHPPAAAHAPEAFSKDPQDAKLELAERGAHDRKLEPPARTIADEQRERSEEMLKQGVDAWKAEHDERSADEKPKVVPGVSHRPVEAYEARGNSTPAARTAQHPAAPR
jgi:hypothetical protein